MPRYPQSILVSCEVPWDENEELVETTFRTEIRLIRKSGFNHVYIFGTAGEGYAVDTARFNQIATIFPEETRDPDANPMVGVIALSTAVAIERLTTAYELGFRTFQIALPSWGTLNDVELLTFFKDVCGTFADASFLHYNLPRAGRLLTGADYRRLIDAVPNLVATKNTGGGMARAMDLMTHVPEIQHFFGEQNFPHGCLHGECSLLSSLAAMAPEATFQLFEAGRSCEFQRLFHLQHFFQNLLHGTMGDLLQMNRIDGAYDKVILRLGGLEEMPLRLLSPYQGFTEEQYRSCKSRYKELFDSGRPPGNNFRTASTTHSVSD